MDPSTKPTTMSKEDWENLERKEKTMIHLCFLDLILLNVFGEYSENKSWEKLGNLYQSMFLVNKLFLRNKLYHLR